MLLTVKYHWRDNNGKVAQSRLFLPADTIGGQAIATATLIGDAMQGVSDAALERIELLTSELFTGSLSPQPTADVRRAVVFFYRNGDDVSSLRLPSPSLLLAETSGFYAGVRITRGSLELSALLPQVEGMVTGTLDPVGRPFGPTFLVGGYTTL